MNVSPFKLGDYIRIKPDFFTKPKFEAKTSPLQLNEIGVVTKVTASGGDKRPRYVEVNGKPPLFHHSMFEAANPSALGRVMLNVRRFYAMLAR